MKSAMYVDELYKKHATELKLELIAGKNGLTRKILLPEIERPGVSLIGYLKGHVHKRALVFSEVEIGYLKDLPLQKRLSCLSTILSPKTPLIIVTKSLRSLPEMTRLCEERNISLFRSHVSSSQVLSRLTAVLADVFAPSVSCHGSFVEIFGIGVLIQGEAAIGKSEAALGLVERGHRLISDDIVKFKKRDGYLEGFGIDVSRHHMQVRGIGIINIARLYGTTRVREKKSLDIVVKLEVWNDSHFYDPCKLEQESISFLGIDVPYYSLPVKAGRDIVLLLETIALNHRFKNLSAIECKGKKRLWESNG